ncbi:MAG: hypothetical protein WCH62_04310 [Candidatus Omnitrophota bacterium]
MNKILMFLLGFLLVAAGLGLVFLNWAVLVGMVKAFSGVVLALVGVVMMFAAGFKK